MINYSFIKKALMSSVVFGLYINTATAYASLDVSQQPLMLVDSVAPNIILTLDDSGSMRFSFVPDSIASLRDARRTKSSAFNPMYYNPEVEYLVPIRLDSNGDPAATGYSTSFSTAYRNGFQSGHGSLDLSDGYKVSWDDNININTNYNYSNSTNYTGTGRVYRLAQNPSVDFDASCSSSGNNQSCTVRNADGKIVFTLTRKSGYYNSTRCSATAAFDGLTIDVPCSRSNNSSQMYASLQETPVPAYYYTLSDTASCQANPQDESCYNLVRVSSTSGIGNSDERQNFANWYSFYRNRALATMSAATLAFDELPSSARFTWQSLNSCTSLNNTNSCNGNRFRAFGGQHKYTFFEWMRSLPIDSGTPLREALDRAGKFLQTDTAWAHTPNPPGGNTVTSPVLACRPSYHIMMTDGMWNGTDGSPTGDFRHDSASFTLPDGESYSGSRHPYVSDTSNTLADLAMHYWATDLHATANELKPYTPFTSVNPDSQYWDPRNNPATWQHMVNFTVGLGLSSALNQTDLEWTGNTFSGTAYQNLANGTPWPAPEADSANNVYDLWHTAINSRGEFFSADSPEALVESFQEVLGRIAARASTASKPGISTSVSIDEDDLSNVEISNRLFEAQYDSQGGWAGDLVRKDMVRTGDGSTSVTEVWKAADKLTSAAGRNIYMAGGGDTNLKSFSWQNLSNEQQARFHINPDGLGHISDNRGLDRVNYVRGSRAHEGSGDNDFRIRTTVLGDIINSSPVVVSRAQNVPYLMDRIDGEVGDYLTYMQTTTARPELVYVGANDGMLHAFFTGTEEDSVNGGNEAFAFIPSAVLPNLPKLTGKTFNGGGHRFYVDGTPEVRDVYINDGWRTVLVGTLRAGGKSVFALDITNPGVDGSGVKLLWEISSDDDDYADLGYSFTRPEIARLHSGQWGVLLGNGYDSADGKAVMYVVDISNGDKLARLEVDDGGDGANGLSSVRGADNNSDGVVDYAYAGDLKGNVWRFDLVKTGTTSEPDPFARSVQTGVTPSTFKTSFLGQPLFTATHEGEPQPITALPSLVRHPTQRGYLVIVGTGKYFETSDASADTSKPNTIYAIWDRYTKGQNGTPSQATRSNMEARTITTETTGTFGSASNTVRVVSSGTIQWYNAGTTPSQEANENAVNRRGWYLDLAVNNSLKGEMMVNDMLARGGTLLFTTITPNADPCADGLVSYLYGINAATGARLRLPPFDYSQDGIITSDDFIGDVPPSGIEMPIPGGIPLTPDGLICANDGDCIEFILPPEKQGRSSWQELPVTP